MSIEVEGLTIRAGELCILEPLSLGFPRGEVSAIVGPSGSGKTSFLRALNRLADESDGLSVSGEIRLAGVPIRELDVNLLRQRVGMVFQKPVVFPGSIQSNVTFGLRHLGLCSRSEVPELARRELERVGLLGEVEDRLHGDARMLSLGQQQRLCLARTLALNPEVLLLDEPTSALDPLSVQKIESLVLSLTETTVILVTHALSQARRLARQLIFLSGGRLVELGQAEEMFGAAEHEETRRFLRSGM